MNRLILWVAIALAVAGGAARGATVRVGASISLQEALGEVAAGYEKASAERVELTFGSAGQIVNQAVDGAPLDVIVSADRKPLERLFVTGLAHAEDQRVVAQNELVLVTPPGRQLVARFEDLANAEVKRIAIGQPDTVPAGAYALEALRSTGILERVRDRLVYGSNVRQALEYVERGEVDAGIVYRTDAAGTQRVRAVATADAAWHRPIEYVAVPIQGRGAEFIAYFAGPEGQAALKRYGFGNGLATAPPSSARTSFTGPLLLSLRIALAATLLAALVAVPLAYLLARRRFGGKALVEGVIMMPLVLPPTVVGYTLITLLGAQGLLTRWLHDHWGYSVVFRIEGAVLAAAIVAVPMLYIPLKAAFASVDRELEEIARLMGAGRIAVFWHVSLPLARRGFLSGIVLAFARALGEFGATVMVFGWQPGRLTLPISIYAAYEQGELSRAGGAVAALAGMSLGLILLYNAMLRREQ